MTLRNLAIGCFLLCLPLTLNAQPRAGQCEMASARKFVQAFYDWYAPMAVKAPSLDAVLKKKPSVLAPALAHALKEYLADETKSSGELVGLDFDPFLNSQDPVARYHVVSVKKEGKGYRVRVQSAPMPGSTDTTSVVAEVARRNGKWCFTNFRYPEGSDLLKELATSSTTARSQARDASSLRSAPSGEAWLGVPQICPQRGKSASEASG